MPTTHEVTQIKKYIKSALASKENIVVQYATGRNSSYKDKNMVINRLWILASPNALIEYEIFVDKWSITVGKTTSTNNGSGTLIYNDYHRYTWQDDYTFMTDIDPEFNKMALTREFNALYNRVLEIVEDIMEISIEEFTNHTMNYKV